MRKIYIVCFCAITGAILTSLIMLCTIPEETLRDPMAMNYNHEVETLTCIFFTIPMGGYLGSVTGYTFVKLRKEVVSAAKMCLICGLILAVPLLIEGCLSVLTQMRNPYPSPEFPHWGERPHWIQEFLSIGGFSLMWSIVLASWGFVTIRRHKHWGHQA